MEHRAIPSWPRLTLYVSVVGRPEDDDGELRAVVVTPGRTVLWADLVRGTSSELEDWAAERLISGVLPGSPRLQQLGPFDPHRLVGCPDCGRPRFPVGPSRSLCPSCDRDEEAPRYAAMMAHRVQADYMTEEPAWSVSSLIDSAEPSAESELTLPTPLQAGYAMVKGTLQDAVRLARQSGDRTDAQARTSRTTAYGLVLQVSQWLSAPAELWLRPYENSEEVSPSASSPDLPSWEEFAELSLADQQQRLTSLLDLVGQVVQDWGRNPDQPPPALVFHPAPAREPAGAAAVAGVVPEAIRQAVLAAMLALGVICTDTVEAREIMPMPPSLDRALDEVALRRLPAIRVVGTDQALVEALTQALAERGVPVATAFSQIDPAQIGTLSVTSQDGTLTIVVSDPRHRTLLKATVDRTGQQMSLSAPSSPLATQTNSEHAPTVATIDAALDHWLSELNRLWPATTPRTIIVGPMTWPHSVMGSSRLIGAEAVRKAVAARAKKRGFTVVADGAHPMVMGGLWDREQGRQAFLWLVEPSGRVRPISQVTLPMPGWVTTTLPGPEAVFASWTESLARSATELSTALRSAGLTAVGLPLHVTDADDQPVPAQAETIRRLLWPSLIRALDQAGLAAYVPRRGHQPDAQIVMQVDWQFVTPVSGSARLSEVLVTFGLDLVHPPDALQAGSWTARLSWPRQVPAAQRVADLPGWPLVMPARWAAGPQLTVPGVAPLPSLALSDQGANVDLDPAKAGADRDTWWRAQQAHQETASRRMRGNATTRLPATQRQGTKEMEKAWQASPSQEVPATIRNNVEELRRFRRQVPGGKSMEQFEKHWTVPERDRPYPRG